MKVLLAVGAYGQNFGSIYDGDGLVMRSVDGDVSLDSQRFTVFTKIKEQGGHHATHHQNKRHDLEALLRPSRRSGKNEHVLNSKF